MTHGNSFRPLSWGLSFNKEIDALNEKMDVFVPFLGDFLSIKHHEKGILGNILRFRPLSWGLSFNTGDVRLIKDADGVFSSPFLGTFFQYT